MAELAEPLHGKDGWLLADYSWDEETGLGTCTYHRGPERAEVVRVQPSGPQHPGWEN